jgi:O-antigen/teichoic acid export membrane protein
MLSTWAAKFNMILLSVSTGVIVSLIPNLTESVVKNKDKDIQNKITKSLSILLYLTIPMTLGISFLSKNIWTVFYGASKYGPSVLGYYIFAGLFVGLFTSMIITLQTLKDYKGVFISLISGVLVKIILNMSLLRVITASILGYLTSFIICLVILYHKYNINFENVMKYLVDIMSGSILMIIILFIIRLISPSNSGGRVINIFIILFYAIIGCGIYLVYTSKTKTIKSIFGNEIRGFLNKIKK